MLKVRTLNLSFYSLPFLAFQSKNKEQFNSNLQRTFHSNFAQCSHSCDIFFSYFLVSLFLSLLNSFNAFVICVSFARIVLRQNCTSPIYLHNRLRLKIVYIKYAGGRCDSISFSLSISLFHSVSLTLTHLDELLCWIFSFNYYLFNVHASVCPKLREFFNFRCCFFRSHSSVFFLMSQSIPEKCPPSKKSFRKYFESRRFMVLQKFKQFFFITKYQYLKSWQST